MRLCEIINCLDNCICIGNKEIDVNGLNLCNREPECDCIISYVTNEKFKDVVQKNYSIKVLVVTEEHQNIYSDIIFERDGALIISKEPEKDFYSIHNYLYKRGDFYYNFDFDSRIGENCNIDPRAVIEKGVVIGNNVTIGPLTVIRKGTVIEDDVVVGCNAVIGAEGFQIVRLKDLENLQIPHVGGCYIGRNVYIGDGSCIEKSLFDGNTYIGENTKIDNLICVGHNSYVGKNVVIATSTAISGSVIIEDNAWIAPNVSILNKVVIGNGSKVGIGSVVTRSVQPNTVVYGCPAKVH